MEKTSVQKLAAVLRVLVLIAFVCSLIALLLVPYLVSCDILSLAPSAELTLGTAVVTETPTAAEYAADLIRLIITAFGRVWGSGYTAVLSLFLWGCGVCCAVILWQGKRVLDTILRGEPFSPDNAVSLRRAAVCCFAISGAALARTVWGLIYYHSAAPLLSYNTLFVPVFLLPGLVCMVMSALFRQAAELKAENDLTI